MTRGVLIFAFNNTKLNYFKQANWVADRVKQFLNLPTTIVTDEKSLGTKHNIIIKKPESLCKRNFDTSIDNFTADWFNASRFQAYNISPYEETIVIDSDYIVNSDQLNLLFHSPYDFLCHRHVYDVANNNNLVDDQIFGDTHFPHYWATVIFFRKAEFAKIIFNLIEMVKDNFEFYGKLYKFRTDLFRNDYAVSIALGIAYGHRFDAVPTIPWMLPTATTSIIAEQISNDSFRLMYDKHYRNKNRIMNSVITGHDFHCLNKIAMEKIIDNAI